MILTAFALLTMSAHADPKGYGPLPAEGCPSVGGFYLDHFAPTAPFFRGGSVRDAGVPCLKELGIAAVLDLRTDVEVSISKEPEQIVAAGINYLRFPMSTDEVVASEECRALGIKSTECNSLAVDRSVNKIKELLSFSKKIYIHCARGEDRTGLVIGMFRRRVQDWDRDRARKEMRDFWYAPYPVLERIWERD